MAWANANGMTTSARPITSPSGMTYQPSILAKRMSRRVGRIKVSAASGFPIVRPRSAPPRSGAPTIPGRLAIARRCRRSCRERSRSNYRSQARNPLRSDRRSQPAPGHPVLLDFLGHRPAYLDRLDRHRPAGARKLDIYVAGHLLVVIGEDAHELGRSTVPYHDNLAHGETVAVSRCVRRKLRLRYRFLLLLPQRGREHDQTVEIHDRLTEFSGLGLHPLGAFAGLRDHD